MSKPKIAGLLLLLGGLWSTLIAIAMTAGTVFFWVPAYACCGPLALVSIIIGIILLTGAKIPRALAITGAVTQIMQLMDCDMIGVGTGIAALVILLQPDTAAILAGEELDENGAASGGSAAIAAPPGASGLMVHSGFFPLAFLLFFTHPVVKIGDLKWDIKWGKQFIEVPPGSYAVEIFFPYIGMNAGKAQQVDVPVRPAHVTMLDYSAPWLMTMGGTLKVMEPKPNAAGQLPPTAEAAPVTPPPAAPPQAAPPQTPPPQTPPPQTPPPQTPPPQTPPPQTPPTTP